MQKYEYEILPAQDEDRSILVIKSAEDIVSVYIHNKDINVLYDELIGEIFESALANEEYNGYKSLTSNPDQTLVIDYTEKEGCISIVY